MEWKEPPENLEDKLLRHTLKELRANPGRWAKIADHSGGLFMSPKWWHKLAEEPDIETHLSREAGPWSPGEIFARHNADQMGQEQPAPVDPDLH